MSSIARCLIIMMVGLSISVLYPLGSITPSFSQNEGAIDISIVDSGFVPLTNTDANQVRVNVGYTIEDESLQNQIINAVMKVYDPDGTLIRTTSIPGGFTAQSNGGVEVLRTNILESMQSVSININFTDLTKENTLSNTITEELELETASFDSNSVDNNSGSNDEDNDNSSDDDNDSRDDDDDDSRDEDDENDGGDKDCSDFDEKNFEVQPGDPHGLDRDGDGIACES